MLAALEAGVPLTVVAPAAAPVLAIVAEFAAGPMDPDADPRRRVYQLSRHALPCARLLAATSELPVTKFALLSPQLLPWALHLACGIGGWTTQPRSRGKPKARKTFGHFCCF